MTIIHEGIAVTDNRIVVVFEVEGPSKRNDLLPWVDTNLILDLFLTVGIPSYRIEFLGGKYKWIPEIESARADAKFAVQDLIGAGTLLDHDGAAPQ